jgi:hypothetical protein
MKVFVEMIDHRITEVISGGAAGIDKSGEDFFNQDWQKEISCGNLAASCKLIKFPADWDKFVKAAGHIRNKQMAEYADALLLIWDGESRGSANMKETMLKLNKPVYEVILRKHNV